MIVNEVYRLKKATEVAKDMPLQAGQEVEVVQDVVYINGHLVPPQFQPLFLNWIKNNPQLFDIVTRRW